MTRRSQQRWNAGKRGASQRAAYELGLAWNVVFHLQAWQEGIPSVRNEIERRAVRKYPRSGNMRSAFKRGAWKWVGSQPVEF